MGVGLADRLGKAFSVVALRSRRVRVIALVGKSGSGKSFHARLMAEEREIDIVIDDGLVIDRGTILTGHWAKKEQLLMVAVRKALFAEQENAREARKALRHVPFRRVLIVATSQRLAEKIAGNLWLPAPMEFIPVEGVATRGEIRTALRRRGRHGMHSSPVPEVRVRRNLLSAIRLLLRGGGARKRRLRIVGPAAEAGSSTVISESAVVRCVEKFDTRIHVQKVSLLETGGMTTIELSLTVPRHRQGSGRMHDLSDFIMHGLEKQLGIIVREVKLTVAEAPFSN